MTVKAFRFSGLSLGPAGLAGLLLSILLIFPAARANAAGYDFRLPDGVRIGEISGPGSEQLSRALKKRAGRGAAEFVLSGQVSLSQASQREKELVPREKAAGPPYEDYLPDPFTGRVWRQEVNPTATALEGFDLERYQGLMILDWTLSAGGRAVNSGRTHLDINRTRGGYLAREGLAPPLASAKGADRGSDKKFETRLADDLVRQLALDLGRAVTASDLERAGDKWSRRARGLASAGDWEGARKEWEALLEMNPNYGPALYNLGVYWEKAHRPEEALRYYRAAFVSEASVLHRQTLTRLTETLSRAGRLPGRMSQSGLE